jgi:hypothetical protein
VIHVNQIKAYSVLERKVSRKQKGIHPWYIAPSTREQDHAARREYEIEINAPLSTSADCAGPCTAARVKLQTSRILDVYSAIEATVSSRTDPLGMLVKVVKDRMAKSKPTKT